MDQHDRAKRSNRMLLAIGIFKLVKAGLLVAIAAGTLKFLDADTAEALRHWARASQIVMSHEPLRRLLAFVSAANEATLIEISAASLVYAALFATEGVGLCLRKRWAEYFTIIMTGSLIPFEVYELVRRVTLPKLVVTAINVAVLCYLIWNVRRASRDRRPACPAAA
jgi:uncharacterized membrane protein (DUF2068 family)